MVSHLMRSVVVCFEVRFIANDVSCPGCMREVWVNHKLFDFNNAARTQKVNPGCSLISDENDEAMEEEDVLPGLQNFAMRQQEEASKPVDPCANHQCRRGSKCIPGRRQGDYTCRCALGFTGKFCDRGKTPSDFLLTVNLDVFILDHLCSASAKTSRTIEE